MPVGSFHSKRKQRSKTIFSQRAIRNRAPYERYSSSHQSGHVVDSHHAAGSLSSRDRTFIKGKGVFARPFFRFLATLDFLPPSFEYYLREDTCLVMCGTRYSVYPLLLPVSLCPCFELGGTQIPTSWCVPWILEREANLPYPYSCMRVFKIELMHTFAGRYVSTSRTSKYSDIVDALFNRYKFATNSESNRRIGENLSSTFTIRISNLDILENLNLRIIRNITFIRNLD